MWEGAGEGDEVTVSGGVALTQDRSDKALGG